RQSILQDAVQGRLTAQWRQAHPNQEPASELLRRIRAEKAAAGKKEKTLPPVTAEEMPFELPEGWVWCRLGEVALFSEAGKSLKCDDRPIEAGEWGIIKMSAVSSKVFVEAHNKFLSKKAPNDLSNKIECGDLIFTRASGSKELTGVSSMVKILSSNLLLNDKTIRFKFIDNETAEFVQLFNNSFFARQYYEKIMSAKSTSMNNLTRPQFNGLPVPLPPLSEQTAIVARVEAMLERVSDMEAESARQRVWAEGLLQAALREAMGG
ncbi:MAG TPA: restriction endonuclease subunit S, partial [Saprospiraceae bacterium]|nr:restriction endonuclease subunit S [Saprospiraceae bacterium]